MASASLVRQLGSLFDGGSLAGLSDRQLLERFNHCRDDEAAFAALVARHGPMVLAVCRRIVGDHHHAEDAFQAVFLVLARKARALRDPDRLAPWLHGVAVRTARKARTGLARRRTREQGDPMPADADATPSAPPADQTLLDRDQAEALHVEVDRLPEVFRTPVVLCYFEGLTLDEAAHRMRWPAETLRSRLARAREKLRRALTRRGVVLSTTALAAALDPRPASAGVSPHLCDLTARAAIGFAARPAIASTSAALAQEVLRAMTIHKLKLAAVTVFLIGATIGAGRHALNAPAHPREGEPPGEPIAQVARQEPRTPDVSPPAQGRMTVVGRVLDTDGRPVAGAAVDLFTRFRSAKVGAGDEAPDPLTLQGRGRSEADGQFRLDATRTASARVFRVYALAAAPGYGLGWAALDPDAESPSAEIRLLSEQTVRVRLVDVNGQPARGVEVRLLRIGRRTDDGLFDGITISDPPPEGIRVWPRPVTTDDRGRAAFPGVGRGRGVQATLVVRDLRYAQQNLQVDTIPPASGGEVTLALEPARIIEGRVLAADNGRPIPGASILIGSGRRGSGGSFLTRFRADDQGRFTANPAPGDSFRVSAFAPDDQPYLVPQVGLTWPRGAVKQEIGVRLPRGVLLRGKVTEAGTNRPLPDSTVYFAPVKGPADVLSGTQASVASGDDGSYRVAVLPGKGHLLVVGPTGDFVASEIGMSTLDTGRPGGWRFRAHAIIPYEVKPGDPPHDLAVTLRPGVTIKGRVEGPDGRAVADALVLTTLRIEARNPIWDGNHQIPVRGGRFELHGLAPDASTRIHVLDPEHEWGATVDVSGRQAGQDLTVRLQACGRARARFVGPDGRPAASSETLFELVMTPGPSRYTRRTGPAADALTADADFLGNIDRKHYRSDPAADAEGRVTLGSLIPGAVYRITDFSTANNEGGRVRKDFTVKPGETIDLGDILIQRPPG